MYIDIPIDPHQTFFLSCRYADDLIEVVSI